MRRRHLQPVSEPSIPRRQHGLPTLSKLGVDARYADRDYRRTQEVADAAFFLGFDGLIAPSARWACLNLVLFTDRIPPDRIQALEAEAIAAHEFQRLRRPTSAMRAPGAPEPRACPSPRIGYIASTC
ncbi:MAG TPA: RES domain-containing protein [Beijerinckiaceae bacterium]|nr:RES domain-containing protein [Beijerinckiaceae bacterium]